MPLSFNAEDVWPAERRYNFLIQDVAVTQVRNGDNAGKDQVNIKTVVTKTVESDGYQQQAWLATYTPYGVSQILQLIKAVTGQAPQGDVELTDDELKEMLVGGIFSANLKHQVEDDVITRTNFSGKFGPFEPELENETADNGEFSASF